MARKQQIQERDDPGLELGRVFDQGPTQAHIDDGDLGYVAEPSREPRLNRPSWVAPLLFGRLLKCHGSLPRRATTRLRGQQTQYARRCAEFSCDSPCVFRGYLNLTPQPLKGRTA